MAKLYDMAAIAEGDELVAIAFKNNPNLQPITYEYAAMVDKDKETRVVGIRFPVELLSWIDRYSRIEAVTGDKRVTRNATVIGFLEMAKGIIEYREQHEFEGTHIEEIEKILAVARSRQPGNQSDGEETGQ